jgi:hypothetical protein
MAIPFKSQITSEIDYFLDFYKGIEAKAFLSYEREAYTDKYNPEFRLTLDENILARDSDLDLGSDICGESLLPRGTTLMEVKIADMTGLSRRNTPAYNEGGLMAILPLSDTSQQLVQLGVFPLYNCGNMLTTILRRGRQQYNNQLAYQFDRYLQMQREGNTIYVRTSADGRTWTDMPSSPVSVPMFEGKTLRVGLFQTTYTTTPAEVMFTDFKLWTKKK